MTLNTTLTLTVSSADEAHEAIKLLRRHIWTYTSMPPPPRTPLYELKLSTRVYTLLRAQAVDTVEDLTEIPAGQLSRLPGIGPTALEQIRSALVAYGLTLPDLEPNTTPSTNS